MKIVLLNPHQVEEINVLVCADNNQDSHLISKLSGIFSNGWKSLKHYTNNFNSLSKWYIIDFLKGSLKKHLR